MQDAELLARATAFDAGPVPIVNGKLFDPGWVDATHYHAKIEQRRNAQTGDVKWAIVGFGSCLSKTGKWEYEGLSSGRTKPFLERCRYNSIQEAFDHWFRYHKAVTAWAQKRLAKDPTEVLSLPQRFRF
jgi:hypothetical protein